MKSETIKSILIALLLCVDVYEERLRRGLRHELEVIPKIEYTMVTNIIVNASHTNNTETIIERIEKLEQKTKYLFPK